MDKHVSVCNHATRTAIFREIQYYYAVGWLRPQPDGQGSYDAWYQMHFDGCNFVFADGHLKFVKLHQVPADSNNKFWNFDDKIYKVN
jgi:prepilin-type processing-associated H-X9-DG protein